MNARMLRRATAYALGVGLTGAVLLAYLQPSGVAALMQLAAFCR
ncbi:hypothetical protein [Variovorax sp. JS1663]|nr:hypothetical protein [Variovorax sp. JS1663]